MAARFWVGQSGGGNYSSTDWATTSGGTTGQLAPTSSDDVTFDGAGTFGNTACTVTATANALSVTFTTGYTSTITINNGIGWTIAGNFTDRTNHTWVVTGTGSITISAASTITSNGKTFPGTVGFSGSNTKTLVGDWTITGLLSCQTTTTTINKTTAEVLSCAGWTVTGATTGSINITITGGTWSGAGAITISGTINLAGSFTYSATSSVGSGTLKYTSGTITQTSTLLLSGAETLDTNGMTWTNVNLAGTSQTFTINSLFSVSGTLGITGTTATTFAGTAGFSVGTLSSILTAGHTVTLKNSVTYTVTASLTAATGRVASQTNFTSDDGTLKATLTLNSGATCACISNFTRIDASNGRAIYTFNSTVTTCNNIFSFTDALPPAIGRVIHAGATY